MPDIDRVLSVGLFTVMLSIIGCTTYFDVPPNTPQGFEVDPTPYLGTWLLETVNDNDATNPGATFIVSQNAQGDLTLVDPEGTIEEIFELTKINNKVIGSLKNRESEYIQSPIWMLGLVALEDNDSRLRIKTIDEVQVKDDIDQQVISGTINELEEDRFLITVTASAAQLRTYLENHPDIFSSFSITLVRPQE